MLALTTAPPKSPFRWLTTMTFPIFVETPIIFLYWLTPSRVYNNFPGIGSAWSYPISCRLSTNSCHRYGYYARKNYNNNERIYYLSTGKIFVSHARPTVCGTWREFPVRNAIYGKLFTQACVLIEEVVFVYWDQALKYLLQGRLTKCPMTLSLSLGRTYV